MRPKIKMNRWNYHKVPTEQYENLSDVVVVVEAEWSAAGDVGDGADESVLDAICRLRQVHEFWASSFHHAVLRVLELAPDTDWLARITNWSLGQTPADQADSM